MAIFVDNVVDTSRGRVSFGESGTGPVRIVLHSLLTDRKAFDGVAEALGGRLIAVDLPGFGSTDPAAPNIDDYADRIAAFIEAMGLEDEGLTLIGNGLGAFVALGTAIHHGDNFDRLLLVGCGPGFPQPAKDAFSTMIETVKTGGTEAVIPIALRRIFTEDYVTANPEIAEERASVLRRTDPGAFVTACQALQDLDYSALASSVAHPTLIVVGEEDQATPPKLAEELHRIIANSTLMTMPGVAHAPQIQDPDAFLRVIEPFLEGR